jgi:NADH-quinone oxidoreductase subunit H
MAEFWTNYIWPLIVMVAQSVLLLVLLLLVTAYVLYADRKIWAAVQIRRGPNVVGPWGLLQSFADLIKFVVKEPIIPDGANKGVFLLAPLVTAALALSAWAVIPVNPEWAIADLNIGILYIFAISSLMVYGVIMAGWSSNSKYPFLASLRSAAQMVSYEVSIGFVFITVLLCAGSLNLNAIVDAQEGKYGLLNWFWLPLFPMFVVFFVSALAETNRPPFDLVEAESELVAGYAVEYSATPFLLFFLGEYIAILTMCAMATVLFLGGWLPPFPVVPFTWVPGPIWFTLKCLFIFFLFAMVKAIVPRYRYDQLMRLGWKVFLPLSLAMVAIVAGVLQYRPVACRAPRSRDRHRGCGRSLCAAGPAGRARLQGAPAGGDLRRKGDARARAFVAAASGAGSRYYRVRRHRLLARPSLRGLSHRGPTETARRHGLPERMAP